MDYFFKCWGDSWKYDKLLEYEHSLENLMNEDGVIFLKYIMSYVKSSVSRERIFPNSGTKKSDLTTEEVYRVKVPFQDTAYAGMVLKRIKMDGIK